jgi:uncharacterized glyoxalase superfamily protein PhnB
MLNEMAHDDGTIMHGTLKIGAALLFISEAGKFGGPSTANTFLYLENVDEVFASAVAAGAKVLAPLTTMFWGDRWGMIQDPAGNIWQLAKHVEDVPPAEMMERAKRAKQ